jgi:hypothetical protein
VVHRYYDPGTGEFLTVDPEASSTLRPYNYAKSDPANEEDPLGLFAAPPSTDACLSAIAEDTDCIYLNAWGLHGFFSVPVSFDCSGGMGLCMWDNRLTDSVRIGDLSNNPYGGPTCADWKDFFGGEVSGNWWAIGPPASWRVMEEAYLGNKAAQASVYAAYLSSEAFFSQDARQEQQIQQLDQRASELFAQVTATDRQGTPLGAIADYVWNHGTEVIEFGLGCALGGDAGAAVGSVGGPITAAGGAISGCVATGGAFVVGGNEWP